MTIIPRRAAQNVKREAPTSNSQFSKVNHERKSVAMMDTSKVY
jgi:hypothetical protein